MAETLIGGAWQQPQFAESDVRHSRRRTCNTPPAAPRGCWPHCRTRSMPASTSLPPERGLPWPARPAGTNPPPGARHYSNARISPLSGGTSTVTTSPRPQRCVACQPHEPVIDVSCSGRGDGPLITGQPPELGDQLAPPARDWLHSRGWQLHPRAAMPRRPEIAASSKSPCAMTLRILHQSSSQADSERFFAFAMLGCARLGYNRLPSTTGRTHGHPDPRFRNVLLGGGVEGDAVAEGLKASDVAAILGGG